MSFLVVGFLAGLCCGGGIGYAICAQHVFKILQAVRPPAAPGLLPDMGSGTPVHDAVAAEWRESS